MLEKKVGIYFAIKRKQCKEKDGVCNEHKKFAKVNEQIPGPKATSLLERTKYSTKRSK